MAMFTAKCTQGKYADQYLSFHSSLVNIGNDFDLNSGTFTTPFTGIYELSLFIQILYLRNSFNFFEYWKEYP